MCDVSKTGTRKSLLVQFGMCERHCFIGSAKIEMHEKMSGKFLCGALWPMYIGHRSTSRPHVRRDNEHGTCDAANFRVGGIDCFRCGSKDDPQFQGMTFYLDIVPDSRIVSSEVIKRDGESLSAALTTFDLSPNEKGTTLTFTVQVVSFMGPEMFRSHEQGYNGALDNLVRHVQGEP
jgi:uncharacterized protein YndB with AHSA1/START domain